MQRRLSLSLAVWISVLAVGLAQSQYQVIHLTEYMRHGARTTWFNSLKTNITMQLGEGNLTANGVRMQYMLGAQLREAYPMIFQGPWKGTNVEIYSSSVQRTIMSAQSQLFGLFPLGTGDDFTLEDGSKYGLPPFSGLNVSFSNKSALPRQYRPFPYDIKSEQLDYDFFPNLFHTCPSAKDYAFSRSTPLREKYLYLVKELGEEVTKAGFDPKTNYSKNFHDIESLALVYDEAKSYFNYYGEHYPGLNAELYQRLYRVGNLHFSFLFPDDKMQRMLADGIAQKIVTSMEAVVQNKSATKFTLFSGHDTGMFTHMVLYGLASQECMVEKLKNNSSSTTEPCHDIPEFATPFLYELALKNGTHYVRTLYAGKPFKVCEENEDEFYCEFTKFKVAIEKKLYFKDSSKIEFCGNPLANQYKKNTSTHFDLKIAIVAVSFVSLLILTVLIVIVCKISKLKKAAPELSSGDYKRVTPISPSIMIPRDQDTTENQEIDNKL